jgi:hypothetical protein
MFGRKETENDPASWKTSEVHILDENNLKLRIMQLRQSQADEMQIEMEEETGDTIKPLKYRWHTSR